MKKIIQYMLMVCVVIGLLYSMVYTSKRNKKEHKAYLECLEHFKTKQMQKDMNQYDLNLRTHIYGKGSSRTYAYVYDDIKDAKFKDSYSANFAYRILDERKDMIFPQKLNERKHTPIAKYVQYKGHMYILSIKIGDELYESDWQPEGICSPY